MFRTRLYYLSFFAVIAVLLSGCPQKAEIDKDTVYNDRAKKTRYADTEVKSRNRHGLTADYRFFKYTDDGSVRVRRKKDGYFFKVYLTAKDCTWAKYEIECRGLVSKISERGHVATFMYAPDKHEGVPATYDYMKIRAVLPPQNDGDKGALVTLNVVIRYDSWDDLVIEDVTGSTEIIK